MPLWSHRAHMVHALGADCLKASRERHAGLLHSPWENATARSPHCCSTRLLSRLPLMAAAAALAQPS